MGPGQAWAGLKARPTVGLHPLPCLGAHSRPPTLRPQRGPWICGQCKTGPSAPVPKPQSPAPLGTIWK
ncbi:unnamed protein product [Lota lota]